MVYNPYIVVPFATWAVAQICKFAIASFKGRIDFRNLYASGGMPSVHSAVVTSLAVTAFLVDGPDSHLFGLAAIVAAIVMYDSFGVRRATGEQAAAINLLIAGLDRNRFKLDQPMAPLREILGHKPKEVAVGAVLGAALACLFNYDRLGMVGNFAQGIPGRPETYAYGIAFVVILVAGVVIKLVLKAMYGKSKIMKKLGARIVTATQTVGWLGVISTVLVYEHASYFAWRLWPVLLLAGGAGWFLWLATNAYKTVPDALASEANAARKLKWLRWGRDKSQRRLKKRT